MKLYLLVLCDLTQVILAEEKSQNGSGSFLWRVNSTPASYFFGTIHVPFTQVWNFLPDNVLQAYGGSDTIILELDATNPETVSALSDCQLLPKNGQLSQEMSPDLYSRLQKYMDYLSTEMPTWFTEEQKKNGIDGKDITTALLADWDIKRPIWASFALDHTLKAKEMLKLGIKSALSSDDLVNQYKTGNMVSLPQEQAILPSLAKQNITLNDEEKAIIVAINGYFRREMIDLRNKRMAAKVIDLLNQNPETPFFFAFGTFHFVGTNKTIVDYVRSAGFNVTRVGPNEILPEIAILDSSVNRVHFNKTPIIIMIFVITFFGQ